MRLGKKSIKRKILFGMKKLNNTCVFLLNPVDLARVMEIESLKCFLTKLIGLKLPLEIFDLLRAAC